MKNQEHREWVVKELTEHKTLIKGIFRELKIISKDSDRLRNLENRVSIQKGAGIFISSLFTVILIILTVIR
tara:strand:+ start:177 stop:389 length:213 start_codon:yes stop_codon:yes gene_type:complete